MSSSPKWDFDNTLYRPTADTAHWKELFYNRA